MKIRAGKRLSFLFLYIVIKNFAAQGILLFTRVNAVFLFHVKNNVANGKYKKNAANDFLA